MLIKNDIRDNHGYNQIDEGIAEVKEISLGLLVEQPEVKAGKPGGEYDLEEACEIILPLFEGVFLVDEHHGQSRHNHDQEDDADGHRGVEGIAREGDVVVLEGEGTVEQEHSQDQQGESDDMAPEAVVGEDVFRQRIVHLFRVLGIVSHASRYVQAGRPSLGSA